VYEKVWDVDAVLSSGFKPAPGQILGLAFLGICSEFYFSGHTGLLSW